jgi:hypothetical protein
MEETLLDEYKKSVEVVKKIKGQRSDLYANNNTIRENLNQIDKLMNRPPTTYDIPPSFQRKQTLRGKNTSAIIQEVKNKKFARDRFEEERKRF